MNIIKRSMVIVNIIFFCFVSILYGHLISSIDSGVSALNITGLLIFVEKNPLIISLLGVSFVFFYICSRYSKFFYLIFVSLILFESMSLFFGSFNKVVLLFNFIYVTSAFYFYQLLCVELDEAYYNPCFSRKDIYKKSVLDKLSLLLSTDVVEGSITSACKSSLFFRPETGRVSVSGPLKFEVLFVGKKFQFNGEVMTAYDGGLGIRILEAENTSIGDLGWKELYDILMDRGLLKA